MGKLSGQNLLRLTVLTISIGLTTWAAPEMLERLGWAPGKSVDQSSHYIVQGQDLREVSNGVLREGGVITHTMPDCNALGARLTTRQIRALLNSSEITRIARTQHEVSTRVARAGTF